MTIEFETSTKEGMITGKGKRAEDCSIERDKKTAFHKKGHSCIQTNTINRSLSIKWVSENYSKYIAKIYMHTLTYIHIHIKYLCM